MEAGYRPAPKARSARALPETPPPGRRGLRRAGLMACRHGRAPGAGLRGTGSGGVLRVAAELMGKEESRWHEESSPEQNATSW